YAYLSTLGLLDHVQGASLKGGQYFSFTAVTKNLMELPSPFLVTEPLADHVLELVKNLCTKESDEPIQMLLHKILENLDEVDESLRTKTVALLPKIYAILSTHNKIQLGEHLTKSLTRLAEGENNLEAYTIVVTALANIAIDQMIKSQYDATV